MAVMAQIAYRSFPGKFRFMVEFYPFFVVKVQQKSIWKSGLILARNLRTSFFLGKHCVKVSLEVMTGTKNNIEHILP